jgi:hypothetical protein
MNAIRLIMPGGCVPPPRNGGIVPPWLEHRKPQLVVPVQACKPEVAERLRGIGDTDA